MVDALGMTLMLRKNNLPSQYSQWATSSDVSLTWFNSDLVPNDTVSFEAVFSTVPTSSSEIRVPFDIMYPNTIYAVSSCYSFS